MKSCLPSTAANKEELLEMITHGADKIINSNDEYVTKWLYYSQNTEFMLARLMINDDIDAIIQHGEERTQELNSKYAGLNFDDLNNFKSDSMLQWEGEDYKTVYYSSY